MAAGLAWLLDKDCSLELGPERAQGKAPGQDGLLESWAQILLEPAGTDIGNLPGKPRSDTSTHRPAETPGMGSLPCIDHSGPRHPL